METGSNLYIYRRKDYSKHGTKDTRFYNLIRSPKHSINLYAGVQLTPNFFVSSSVQWYSKRIDNFYNPANFYALEQKTLNAYALWNLYAEYKIKSSCRLFINGKNILEQYPIMLKCMDIMCRGLVYREGLGLDCQSKMLSAIGNQLSAYLIIDY